MHDDEDEPWVDSPTTAAAPTELGRARRALANEEPEWEQLLIANDEPLPPRWRQPPNFASGAATTTVRNAEEDWKQIQQLIKRLSQLLDPAEDYPETMLGLQVHRIDFGYWLGIDRVVYYYNDEAEPLYARMWWPRRFTLRKTLQEAPPEWEREYVIKALEEQLNKHNSLR